MSLLTNLRSSPSTSSFIVGLNANQLRDLKNEITAYVDSVNAHPSWSEAESRLGLSQLRKVARQIKKRIKSDRARPELTALGSCLKREFVHNFKLFESIYLGNGWVFLAGSDGYHCAYFNEQANQVVEYREGDVFVITAQSLATFEREKAQVIDSLNRSRNDRLFATLIDDGEASLEAMATHFAFRCVEFENLVYNFMGGFTSGIYNGGHWQLYTISNDGFYMSLKSNTNFHFDINSNGFEGTLSADAASIVCNLFALCYMVEKYQSSKLLGLYEALLDFAFQHKESGLIARAID